MKKIVLVLIAVFAIVWIFSLVQEPGPASTERAAATEAKASQLAETVTAAVPASPKWSGIQVDEASGDSYRLILRYRTMPSNQAEVERDTRAVLQAALNALVQQGRQPAQEHLSVTVWAQKPETGATGQALTRVFGRALYNFNNDSIEYKAK